MKLQPGGPWEGEADLKQSLSDRNEKDPDKRRGGFIATLSTLVQSPLDPLTEKEQSISNHTISLWDIVCKTARLILFSHTKTDTNANTLFFFFAVFNYCNPVGKGLSWDNTVSDIWQSIEGLLSLCNVEIALEMTKLEAGYETIPVQSCSD